MKSPHGNLSQFYDGTARNVTVSTTPLGLTVILTYNGSSSAPTNIGSYTVIGTINELNYQGSATNTLVIQPVLPFVVTQPAAGQTVVVDSPALFTVTAGGTGPLVYRWKKDGTSLSDGGTISGSGTSNLIISAVSGTDAGIYSVVITNLGGSITSSNALLNVNAQVYVVSTNGVSGGTVSVPMRLRALGREFSLQFSVGFDTSLLTFAGVDDPSVIVTTNSPIPGQVGLTFQNFAGFAPGDQLLVNMVFLVQPVTSNRVGSISFVQLPVAQQVIDSNFELLTNVVYTGGSVQVAPTEYAADVYPRPGGDYTVDLRDWGQIGRYVIGLESPTNADEMLRADCAPRNNADGLLTVADWVQAGRYAAHLDPLTVVSSGAPKMKAMAGSLSVQSKDAGQTRTIQLASLAATNGQIIIVPVSMISVGNENALGFNVTFDPAKLTFRGAAKGASANATQFNVNSNQVASGRLGIALSLSSGSVFPAGSNQLALLSFGVKNTARGKTPVTFVATNPVVEQVCDNTAGVLSASFTSGEITLPPEAPMLQLQLQVGNGSLMLSWPQIYSNYYVQSIENLTSGIWTSNLGSPSVNGTNLQITLPATNPAQFFRLSQ